MQKAFTLYKEHFKITQAPFPNVWRRAAFGNLRNIKKVVETPDSNLRGWKQAFTLIELLVVVLIIGILSAVALPQYQKAVAKVRVARLLPIMKSVEDAQEVYKMTNGEYATDFGVLDIEMPGGAKDTSTTKRMDYNDFSCFLGNTNTTKDSIYCVDNHYNFSLERYYRKYTICWFSKTDNVSKSICTAVCANSNYGSDSSGNTGSCYF